MKKKMAVLFCAMVIIVGFVFQISFDVQAEEPSEIEITEKNIVSYRTHVQTYGWQDFVSNGAMSGTEGQAKRLEAIEIRLDNPEYNGGIQYRTHIQTYSWQDFVSDGAMSGTEGQAKRLEAIQIKLTGEMANHYDIYYRVHSQTFGWLGWAKNGQAAGTAGYAKRLEAIEICLATKGAPAPGSTENCYRHPFVEYRTHVQTYGWQDWKYDGAMSGTEGQAKRLEAITIRLNNQEFNGDIRYRTHIQTYGWQDWKYDGVMSGTEGQAKRLEAIQIELTGEMADQYDVYYRVHSQTFGWLGWAKNGQAAGTEGMARRLEGIEIRLCHKNASDAPLQESRSFLSNTQIGSVSYATYIENTGWQHPMENGAISGTTGQNKQLEAVRVKIIHPTEGYSGGIQYSVHLSGVGWQDWVSDDMIAGLPDQKRGMEAIKLQLTGEYETYCDVYYQAHVSKYGWLGWAKNGQAAGTTGINYKMQALRILILPKGSKAPGSTDRYFQDTPQIRTNKGISNVLGISANTFVLNLRSHENDDFYLGTNYDDIRDARSPNGDPWYNGSVGLNCTGFIWYAFYQAGANPNEIPCWQGAPNCAGGWVSWVRIHSGQVPSYDFRNKSAMLQSGILEKGDIIWIWNENDGGKQGISDTHHVGIFWGDKSNEDRFWHSSPFGGNQISPITGLVNHVSYTVIKL